MWWVLGSICGFYDGSRGPRTPGQPEAKSKWLKFECQQEE